jgi:hypothetical protein
MNDRAAEAKAFFGDKVIQQARREGLGVRGIPVFPFPWTKDA